MAAVQHGFPHFILDIRDEFGGFVIDNFVDEYIAGRTPNPEDFVAMAGYYDSLFAEYGNTSAATKWRIASWLIDGDAKEGYPSMDQYQNAWNVASAFGSVTDPSAFWWFSSSGMRMRGLAIAVLFSV